MITDSYTGTIISNQVNSSLTFFEVGSQYDRWHFSIPRYIGDPVIIDLGLVFGEEPRRWLGWGRDDVQVKHDIVSQE